MTSLLENTSTAVLNFADSKELQELGLSPEKIVSLRVCETAAADSCGKFPNEPISLPVVKIFGSELAEEAVEQLYGIISRHSALTFEMLFDIINHLHDDLHISPEEILRDDAEKLNVTIDAMVELALKEMVASVKDDPNALTRAFLEVLSRK